MNNKKNIISIETSSNICGISFISDGKCIKTIEEDGDRKHIEKIPVFFKEIHKEIGFNMSEISAISVSNGPGSFTGLRIGLSFAKGLALSHKLPIVPVPTMMSLAFKCKKIKPVLGLIHSHGEKIFCQKIDWEFDLPKPSKEIMVLSWNDFLNMGGETLLLPENGVSLFEWASIISEVLPKDTIKIDFTRFKDEPKRRKLNIFGF